MVLKRTEWHRSATYEAILEVLREGWIHKEDAAAEVAAHLLGLGLIVDDRANHPATSSSTEAG